MDVSDEMPREILPERASTEALEAREPAERATRIATISRNLGTWKSSACETVDDGTFQRRTYRIAANGVFADWTRYSSPRCTAGTELMTLRMGGSSKLDRLSKIVDYAAEIRVFVDEKAIVPLSDAGLERLGKACPSANWKIGVERDVTTSGCEGLVPPRATCPVEYDLTRLKSGKRYFGDRAVPRAPRRPARRSSVYGESPSITRSEPSPSPPLGAQRGDSPSA
jgi:hypothetical protein